MTNFKPILFKAPMIKANLDKTKTNTRRIVKPRYSNTDLLLKEDHNGSRLVEIQNDVPEPVKNADGTTTHRMRTYTEVLPKYNKGDILWVRETWEYNDSMTEVYLYRQKFEEDYKEEFWGRFKWKPSIFMPRDAARIFLEVTDVKLQRLQDISRKEAISEGILEVEPGYYLNYLTNNVVSSPIVSFASLWDFVNGKGTWDLNPWVWAYTYKMIDKPKGF